MQSARGQAEKKEADLFDDGGDFMEAVRREVRAEPLIGIDSSRVRFSCWTAMRDQASPTSGALRQIMSGHQLVIRYDAADGGSEEVVFSLDGAGEEISAALGISLEPTETDFLQEELLRFRIEYRHNTCYLLAGKKNRKRCLEAVTACAQKSQDSIFSMTGCIEVE